MIHGASRLLLLLVMTGALVKATSSADAGATLPAFPTAEGFGAYASGGRGGAVYHVTHLDDAGPGSLRYGIETATGPTTIIFDVGGTIELRSVLGITRSRLTLAGQTAPGGGITVAGHSTAIGDGATDVVVRYMRFRAGDTHRDSGAQDSLSVFDAQRIILDHVSTSWGLDETLSVTRSNDVTVQYCIIAEGLNPADHAYGSAVRGRVDKDHPGGYTFHHNLWIHNDRRNPALGDYQQDDKEAWIEVDLVNNVIHNWGARSIHTVRSRNPVRINLVNNVLIAGPSTQDPTQVMCVEHLQRQVYVYESGNLIDSDRDAGHDPRGVTRAMFHTGFFAAIGFQAEPFEFPVLRGRQSAADAYETVLAQAGACLQRDATDRRLVQDVRDRTGSIIVSQTQVGGFGEIAGGSAPLDTDRDGMPDAWERRLGLDRQDPGDGNGIAANGYTNLENYLNSLTGEFAHEP